MSNKLFDGPGMKPMMILPPDSVSAEDVARLNENGICTVVAKDPGVVKFLDTIPSASNRTQIENAAIGLSRKLLAFTNPPYDGSPMSGSVHSIISKLFIDLLIQGSPLDIRPSQAEVERKVYDQEKLEEVRQIAREDARTERAAKKAAVKKA